MDHRVGPGDPQGTTLRALAPRQSVFVASQPSPAPPPKKNSVACLPCKQAKRKCTGQPPPCQACQHARIECVFDPSLDLRRKDARKRTVGERDFYRSILVEVLHGLRQEPARAEELLDFIRNSPAVDPVVAALEHPDSHSDANSQETTGFASAEDALLSLCPQQESHLPGNNWESLLQVPAKPWTRVTDSDDMVSHLVSLYFTWGNPCLQVLDQAVFLAYMNSDTTSAFCTPFLVNCILALAIYSDPLLSGDAQSGRSRFLTEAENLWKAEEGLASITNIQGLLLMCHILNIQGKATLSWMILRQAVQLAQDLGMFGAPVVLQPELLILPEMQRVCAVTAWAVFTMNTNMSLQLHKNANLERPLVPCPTENDPVGIVWSPYPRVGHVPMPAPQFIGAELAKLAEITVGVSVQSLRQKTGVGVDELWDVANELHLRLLQWNENLLGMQSDPVPQAMYLHMKYHEATISIFTPFLDTKLEGVSHVRHSHARETRVLAARAIAQYFHTMGQSYGYEQMPSVMLEVANTALRVAVCDLDNSESEEASVELSHVLTAFSKRFKLAKDIIREVQTFVQQSGLVLPSIFGE